MRHDVELLFVMRCLFVSVTVLFFREKIQKWRPFRPPRLHPRRGAFRHSPSSRRLAAALTRANLLFTALYSGNHTHTDGSMATPESYHKQNQTCKQKEISKRDEKNYNHSVHNKVIENVSSPCLREPVQPPFAVGLTVVRPDGC